MREADLFLPLKKHFKELGYKVYAEVPTTWRSADVVVVKDDEHIAIELKLHLNRDVFHQAQDNRSHFTKSYIATPHKPKEGSEVYNWCVSWGVGILQIMPKGTVVEWLEAPTQTPKRIYDFEVFEELETDEAGVPYNRGKSMAKIVVKRIVRYRETHPEATWKEIYQNVQNHYASHQSMKMSLLKFQGFTI